jgi:hypothetical protein
MRHCTFFLIFSLAFFAVADGEMHPDAVTIMQAASSFVDQNIQDIGWDNDQRDDYVNEIAGIAAQIPEDADLSNFSVDTYINSLSSETAAMLNQMTGDAAYLKQEYLQEVANFFIKEYCNDMKNGVTDISGSDYIADLGRLNSTYEGRVASAQNEGGDTGSAYSYDPEDFLDRAASAVEKRDTKVDFLWAGIQHSGSSLSSGTDAWRLLSQNLLQMVEMFQTDYFHNSVAQADLQYLVDMWPGGDEAYAMNTAYDEGMYYIDDESQTGDHENSYVVDQYGIPTSDDEYEGEENFNVGSGNTSTYITQSYNNRQWGYTNGTFSMVTITTNGRKYSLAENFYTSPIILDMDGNGAFEASGGVWLPHEYEQGTPLAEFDINGDGFPDLCEWVGPNDGLLIAYDGKGTVTGKNLFGQAGGYDNGYEKLLLYDNNRDDMISGEELLALSVWQDMNGNARVDQGEISDMATLGITMLSLKFEGRYVSHYIQNDRQKTMVDWFPTMFVIKRTK